MKYIGEKERDIKYAVFPQMLPIKYGIHKGKRKHDDLDCRYYGKSKDGNPH